MQEVLLSLQHIKKDFGEGEVLSDISLDVHRGEFVTLLGASGCGKTTTLRIISGLETADEGRVLLGGRDMTDLPPEKRPVNTVFQSYALFPHMNVEKNVAYGLRLRGMDKRAIDARVRELLALVDLTDKADVYPSQLSGGQKQRVAIARALANRPRILLSDEATSALDPDATESILALLRDLNRKLGLTIVLITHEMSVIKAICQRVAVMEDGAVVEEGEVYDLFAHPVQPITKRFVQSASPLGKIDKMIVEGSPLLRVGPGGYLVKLLFHRDCVGDSLISDVSRRFGVNLNIVLANVEEIQGVALGGMIAAVEGAPEAVQAALDYLRDKHVSVEVIARG